MNHIDWKIRRFDELSAGDLYQALQLRSKVFVVEQNCIYQDMDGKDRHALHLIGAENGRTIAYSRLFDKGFYFESASIGRVVVDADFRGSQVGHELMRRSIRAIAVEFEESTITISAQEYLRKFYEVHGFIAEGESYLEDGIPHIRMNRH